MRRWITGLGKIVSRFILCIIGIGIVLLAFLYGETMVMGPDADYLSRAIGLLTMFASLLATLYLAIYFLVLSTMEICDLARGRETWSNG